MPFTLRPADYKRADRIKAAVAWSREQNPRVNWWDENVPPEYRIVPVGGPVSHDPRDGSKVAPYIVDEDGTMGAEVRRQMAIICNPDGSSRVAEMSDGELREYWDSIAMTAAGDEPLLIGVVLPLPLETAFDLVCARAAEMDYWADSAAA